jgi:hypothetical protein
MIIIPQNTQNIYSLNLNRLRDPPSSSEFVDTYLKTIQEEHTTMNEYLETIQLYFELRGTPESSQES